MSKKTRPLPPPLKLAQEQFEEWRRTRQSRTIPEPLWSLAVELAVEHGSFRTARALRLNSAALKKRLDSTSGDTPSKTVSKGRTWPSIAGGEPAFIAVDASPTPPRTGSCEGSVEIESASGARMRIEWRRGEAPPDLLALGRSLFGGAR